MTRRLANPDWLSVDILIFLRNIRARITTLWHRVFLEDADRWPRGRRDRIVGFAEWYPHDYSSCGAAGETAE